MLAYYNRGLTYFDLGQMERVIQDLGEAIRLDPVLAEAYLGRAMAYTFLGKDREAQQDVDRALALGFDRGTLDGAIEEIKKER